MEIPVVLVGTKADLASKVITQEDVKAFCEKMRVRHHITISNRTGQNVELAFKMMAEITFQEEMRRDSEMTTTPKPKTGKDCHIM